jgi:phospholipid/cholesterol/gamma-HCH transport system substrate-binding protein
VLVRIRPLRELNQATVAIVGSLVIAGLVLFSVSFSHLPFIARANTYHAEFADAAGIATGDEVRLAGLNVGEVTDVELQGAHVLMTFTAKDHIRVGRDSRLNIRIASILGQEYVELAPAGSGQLSANDVIPQSHTTSPYTLLQLLGTLSTETRQVDLGQLDTSLKILSDDLRTTPATTRAVLDGLSRLSQTIASHSDQLSSLIAGSQQVADTLASRQAPLVALLGNADLVLQTIIERRQVIHRLIVDSANLGQQLTSLLRDNAAQIQPLLANLQSVTAMLARDQQSIDQSVQLLAPLSRYFANATGSGNFVDITAPTLLIPDNVIVECKDRTSSSSGCTP